MWSQWICSVVCENVCENMFMCQCVSVCVALMCYSEVRLNRCQESYTLEQSVRWLNYWAINWKIKIIKLSWKKTKKFSQCIVISIITLKRLYRELGPYKQQNEWVKDFCASGTTLRLKGCEDIACYIQPGSLTKTTKKTPMIFYLEFVTSPSEIKYWFPP